MAKKKKINDKKIIGTKRGICDSCGKDREIFILLKRSKIYKLCEVCYFLENKKKELETSSDIEAEIFRNDLDECIKKLRKYVKYVPVNNSDTSIKLSELNRIVYKLIKNLR